MPPQYATAYESVFTRKQYAVFLVMIFLLELITGILAYLYQAKLVYDLTDNLNKTMLTNYRYDGQKTEAINDLQRTFRCCGAGSFSDWLSISTSVPDSCCKTQSSGCALRSSHPSNIYYKGCVTSLAEFLREHIVILGAIGLGLSCLQIFGISLSCCLARKIKDRKTSRYDSSWQ